MVKYWFRICFEKEFDSKEQAQRFLDFRADEINSYDVDLLNTEVEETK